jgi:hypothetical protein
MPGRGVGYGRPRCGVSVADDLDLHAGAEEADVADDDLVAGHEPFGHLHDAARLVDDAELHVGARERPAGDLPDERLPAGRGGGLPHRALRDDELALERPLDDLSGGEGVALELAVGVGDLHEHRDRLRLQVDGRTHARDAPLDGAAIRGEAHLHAARERRRAAGRHRGGELEHVAPHHGEQLRAARDAFAVLHVAPLDHAVHRREDARVARERGRGAHARLGGREAGLGGEGRLLGGAQVALRHGPGLEEFLRLIEVPLRGARLRARGEFVRLGGAQRGLLLGRLELGQHLSFPHGVALAHVERDEITLDPRPHADRLDGPQVAADRDPRLDDADLDLVDVGTREDDGAAGTIAAARRPAAGGLAAWCATGSAAGSGGLARRGGVGGGLVAATGGEGEREQGDARGGAKGMHGRSGHRLGPRATVPPSGSGIGRARTRARSATAT